jgi:hypothetical protein
MKWCRLLSGRPSKTKKYVLIGALAGLAFGILEAFLTSLNAPDLLHRAKLHFAQFGFACPFLGAVIGYIVAKRIDRRHAQRMAQGLCTYCGYNLTGNVSGTCPECGRKN